MVCVDRQRLARNIISVRRDAGMTCYGMSRALGVSLTAARRWEMGEVLPGLDSLAAIVAATGCVWDDLLRGIVLTDSPPPANEGEAVA